MVKTNRGYIGIQANSNCRFCGSVLHHTFIDLGMSPLCESYLTLEQLKQMEPFYPLHVYVCENCFLVQLEEHVKPEDIFTEYAYFSSYSDAWLIHARDYTDLMVERFKLGKQHQVIEIASNDGYLLQYFVKKGIPVQGVEPAKNVAKVAIQKEIPTITDFFCVSLAKKMSEDSTKADLLIGNNVLAQVPDINDFVKGMKILLKPTGIITLEFPHLMKLIAENQFDTIYHEHFSYFSFVTVENILTSHGLKIFDVEELTTHGGSLRIYACHDRDNKKPVSGRVAELRDSELAQGFKKLDFYSSFGEKVKETKRSLLSFLIQAKADRKSIAGYGAPGKGNTLLNYCGIRTDFLDYTVDRNPYKHGKFTPGTHIPIFPPSKINETKPNYLLILPWNLKEEIIKQMSFIKEWGGKFIVPIPEPTVLD